MTTRNGMSGESWINEILRQLRENGLERKTRSSPERKGTSRVRDSLNLSSNDYLNLARSPAVIEKAEKALREWGAGAGASRLVTGTLPCHEELEQRLASFKGYPSALVFGSGYMANMGIVPALAERSDCVITDKLAHASIIDSAILSRAKLLRFRHNDVNHLADILKKNRPGRRCFIITESVFSMDGDIAPIKDIVSAIKGKDALLIIDEAHATGIFGINGAGLVSAEGLMNSVNICMGTLSKALGGYGGFVTCSNEMRQLLINKSRSFIFSTAIPPAVAGAAIGALDEIEANPEWGAELLSRAERFRKKLQGAGMNTGLSQSQIIPLMVGENQKALALSERLAANGISAIAIRPPTVPEGYARLRLSITMAHSVEELDRAADIIIKSAQEERIL